MTRIEYINALRALYIAANNSDNEDGLKPDWMKGDECATHCRPLDAIVREMGLGPNWLETEELARQINAERPAEKSMEEVARQYDSSAPDKGEIEGTFTAVKAEPQVGGKFTAYLGDEIVGTRTSKTRNYTHAVVVELSKTMALKEAKEVALDKTDRANFRFYHEVAKMQPGQLYSGRSGSGQHFEFPVDGIDVREAQEFVENYPTLDEYESWLQEQAMRRWEDDLVKGAFEAAAVSWHQTQSLANAAADAWVKKRTVAKVWVVKAEKH